MEAKRTGRPPMPEHLRRSLDVSVRVTRAEHANLRDLAERAGVDVSEFVRRRVLRPQRGGARTAASRCACGAVGIRPCACG